MSLESLELKLDFLMKAAEIGEHLTMMNAPVVMTGASKWRRKFII
jgi:hypothetical protein